MNRDCKESLKPIDLINIYEVDPLALKCKNTPNSNMLVNSRPKKIQSNTSQILPLPKTIKGEKK